MTGPISLRTGTSIILAVFDIFHLNLPRTVVAQFHVGTSEASSSDVSKYASFVVYSSKISVEDSSLDSEDRVSVL